MPAPSALLYVRAGCPHCAALRAALEARGVPVKEIDLSVRKAAIPELLKLTGGRRIVPVVVEGGVVSVAPDGGSEF
jgi:glutaredoxin